MLITKSDLQNKTDIINKLNKKVNVSLKKNKSYM